MEIFLTPFKVPPASTSLSPLHRQTSVPMVVFEPGAFKRHFNVEFKGDGKHTCGWLVGLAHSLIRDNCAEFTVSSQPLVPWVESRSGVGVVVCV